MPVTIAVFVADVLTEIGVGAATTAFIGNAIIAAGWTGIAAGLSGLASLLAPTNTFTPEAQKANIKQAVAPRRKYYGTVKIGGVFSFRKAKNGVLYIIILLGEGEFSAFVSHWLDDVQVTLNGSNEVTQAQFTSSGVKRVKIFPQLGTAAQTAYSAMTAAWAGVWTSNHRLRGIANSLLVLKTAPAKDFTGVYPQGIPQYKAVVNSAKVWDPRA